MFSKVYKPFALLTMLFQEWAVPRKLSNLGLRGGYEWTNARIKTWNPNSNDYDSADYFTSIPKSRGYIHNLCWVLDIVVRTCYTVVVCCAKMGCTMRIGIATKVRTLADMIFKLIWSLRC